MAGMKPPLVSDWHEKVQEEMTRDGGEQSTWYGIACWKVWAQGFGSGWAGGWLLLPLLPEHACCCLSDMSCTLVTARPRELGACHLRMTQVVRWLQASCGMAQCIGRRSLCMRSAMAAAFPAKLSQTKPVEVCLAARDALGVYCCCPVSLQEMSLCMVSLNMGLRLQAPWQCCCQLCRSAGQQYRHISTQRMPSAVVSHQC